MSLIRLINFFSVLFNRYGSDTLEFLICKTAHLAGLGFKCYSENHAATLLRSYSRRLCSAVVVTGKHSLISSIYLTIFACDTTSGRSFVYKINKSSPRTDLPLRRWCQI